MLRRLFNTLIETTLQIQPQYTAVNHPFHNKEIEHLGWISYVTPCFPVKAEEVTIINEPDVFYKTLLQRSKEAEYRITLASLYLGTGDLEKVFIDTINKNDHFTNGKLKVSVLLDHARGSRYQKNSRTMLLPLLEKNNCLVSLYHTPYLRGLKKKFAPDRFNEIFGLQHMKLYIFDDYLIISGANLSNDYFTNRQDRYFQIKNKGLADFYDGLVSKVQDFSLQVDWKNNLTLKKGWDQLPYEGAKYDFVYKACDLITNYILDAKNTHDTQDLKNYDTWVYPLIQMGQLAIEQDALVTERILSDAPEGSKFCIATGYFNLTNKYVETIVKDSVADCNFLMAHPNANGFQGAKGMAGGVPDAFSLLSNKFQRMLEKNGQSERIKLFEYLREGWTYHAKGLWYYPPGYDRPCLTLIGSPNFGERSVKLDLETQIAIITENDNLQERLHQECHYLYKLGLPADTNRKIPAWVHLYSTNLSRCGPLYLRGFFGIKIPYLSSELTNNKLKYIPEILTDYTALTST